jgi:hypothetical protein
MLTAVLHLFLYVLALSTRQAYALIKVNNTSFDSVPIMFGMEWYAPYTEYYASLRELPGRPNLCKNEETLLALKTWVRGLPRYARMINERIVKSGRPSALLVSRGGCSFKEKARLAEKMRIGHFLIVYDDQEHQPLVTMPPNDPEISMMMLFVSHKTGLCKLSRPLYVHMLPCFALLTIVYNRSETIAPRAIQRLEIPRGLGRRHGRYDTKLCGSFGLTRQTTPSDRWRVFVLLDRHSIVRGGNPCFDLRKIQGSIRPNTTILPCGAATRCFAGWRAKQV